MRMQKLMETNMTTKITQLHTATLSAIHDAWEQLLKSRGLDFVEGPAAIVEAEGGLSDFLEGERTASLLAHCHVRHDGRPSSGRDSFWHRRTRL